MAPRTDRTTRIPSGVASPVTSERVRVCQLKKWRQLKNWPTRRHARPGPATSSEKALNENCNENENGLVNGFPALIKFCQGLIKFRPMTISE